MSHSHRFQVEQFAEVVLEIHSLRVTDFLSVLRYPAHSLIEFVYELICRGAYGKPWDRVRDIRESTYYGIVL